jgi:predicted small secreted protein
MKTRFLNYSLALVVLCGGYTITPTIATNQQVKVAKSIWKLFSPADGSFRILMPGNPRETKQTVNTKSGKIKLNLFSVERQQEEVNYAVGYVDYSSEYIELLNRKKLVEKALDNGRNNVVKKAKGTLISEQKIRLGSYFGREISYSKPGGNIVKLRIYLVKTRLYQVSAETTKKRQKFLTKSIEGFLNSFNVSSR